MTALALIIAAFMLEHGITKSLDRLADAIAARSQQESDKPT